jgi:hypothetical protein
MFGLVCGQSWNEHKQSIRPNNQLGPLSPEDKQTFLLRRRHLEVKATEPETQHEAPVELSDAAAEPPLEPEVAAEKQKVVQKGAAWGTLAQSDTAVQEQEDALILCYGMGKVGGVGISKGQA